MAPSKYPLIPGRTRRPPKEGWSWVDRRFLREHAALLGRDAILLYFFLAAVSDKDGLSYWADGSIAARLRMNEDAVPQARAELESHDLIAYEHPIYQVLSLPDRGRRIGSSKPMSFREVLRRLASMQDGSCGQTRGEACQGEPHP